MRIESVEDIASSNEALGGLPIGAKRPKPRSKALVRSFLAGWMTLGVSACGDRESSTPAQAEPAKEANASPQKKKVTAVDWEQRYRTAREQVQVLLPDDEAGLHRLDAELREIAASAEDRHLRANACILAASMYDARKDYKTAVSFYKQARGLVPEEPSVHALLAITLASLKDYDAAIQSQEKLVRLDPDDLQAWLILGELNMKAGLDEDAKMAYAAYETRRKGLLDGLTLKKDGKYQLAPEDRARCAHALEAASDNGTALALLYALQSDPSSSVRSAILDVLGNQHFEGYLSVLEEWKAKEPDAELQPKIEWAIAEIRKDPVQTRPLPGDIALPASDEEKSADVDADAAKAADGEAAKAKADDELDD